MKLSDAQIRALKEIAPAPLKRGFFSGWGPTKHGYGAHRVKVVEATADKLISLGLVERRDVDSDPKGATIQITDAGLAILNQGN